MKVLVIGGGGREHALAWKLAASPRVQRVFVAPGNGGTARDARLHNVPLTDLHALADFAQAEKIALTVVGPEAPLAAGVVDAFRARGLRIFGPTRAAAQLESSKAFAKDFMQRHAIPTARYATFTDAAQAHAHIDQHGGPIVVKADGLAAGKGVVVAQTAAEAHAAIDSMLAADAGAQQTGDRARVVIVRPDERPERHVPERRQQLLVTAGVRIDRRRRWLRLVALRRNGRTGEQGERHGRGMDPRPRRVRTLLSRRTSSRARRHFRQRCRRRRVRPLPAA